MIVSQQHYSAGENLAYNDIANLKRTKTILNYLLTIILTFRNVEIKDFENVEKKILKIVLEGKNNVHIVSDFDMTITKYWHNGRKSPSSHDIITKSSTVSDEYHKKCEALKAKYYPIEISPDLTDDEKYPYIVDWYKNANQAILDEKIHKDDITTMCRENSVVFRPGIKDVFQTCRDKEIPFLVFSAGVQNVIQESLVQSDLLYENMKVVSNTMSFNEETGICDKFVGQLYHVFNKNNFGLEGTEYEKKYKNRKNVIVCGDSLGDIKMADGAEHETCLSIGFLNLNKFKMLNKYMNTFDIVITDDGSFDLVNEILRLLN
ncbi:cytosolic 5'-nucleotidase 3-like protein [Piromyces finnis]|uniref:5'-nucleotidase n=1 Tax=Piromyces finnis TaxID=1754191 RepID=A0A1Y1VME0_9FUNG|nr:cytosolic 5'-nucleotidase 3-like protein [Piromyces finnis]|eukprot:ORX60083.1 cytosolic 5'-nucleotidase 3-like protein [Piromyces finnis]